MLLLLLLLWRVVMQCSHHAPLSVHCWPCLELGSTSVPQRWTLGKQTCCKVCGWWLYTHVHIQHICRCNHTVPHGLSVKDVGVGLGTSTAVTVARIALLSVWMPFQEATDKSLGQVCASMCYRGFALYGCASPVVPPNRHCPTCNLRTLPTYLCFRVCLKSCCFVVACYPCFPTPGTPSVSL